jgi:uncharacterized protein (DUF58 family)
VNDDDTPRPYFLRRRADPRLPAYVIAGFGAIVAAIALGRGELAALGAPFLTLAAAGLVAPRPQRLGGSVTVDVDRVIEGSPVAGTARVDWDGVAEVDVILDAWRGVEPDDPAPVVGWSLPAGRGPATLGFRLRARAWGVHDLGALWIRFRRPGGLIVWEQRVATAPTIRVLPSPLRLDRMLRPAEARAVAGMHLSRLRGPGSDFAELRPYQPGDRLRDLSWATSARLGAPWVTVHHPERTGTVLILLDSFFRDEEDSTEALALAARAAWAIASVHLRAQDRVGLLAQGRTVAWVPPQGGRRARWLLLDELLSVGGAAEDRWRRRRGRGRVVVPPDALIVGVTSLESHTFMRDLIHRSRVGHTTVALVIDTSALLPPSTGQIDLTARRLWLARRDAERHALDRAGVLTALVTPTSGVGPAVSTLRRRMVARRWSRASLSARAAALLLGPANEVRAEDRP